MRRGLWISALLAFVILLPAGWAAGALRDRDAVLGLAQRDVDTTALLFQQHALRALEAGDRVLEAMLVLGSLDREADTAVGERHLVALRRIVAGNPQLSAAWFVDAEGRVTAETWRFPPAQVDASQRAYFRFHHDNAGAGLFVGPAEIGSAARRNRFTLSRPVLRDGAFAGAAVVGVLSDYFSELYVNAPLRPGARVTLSTRDGQALATWPADTSPAPPEAEILTASRNVGGFAVRVTVSQPRDAILADWHDRTLATGALTGLGVICFATLIGFGLRSGAREAQALRNLADANRILETRVQARTAELAASESELRALYDAAPVGLAALDLDLRFLRINEALAAMNGIPTADHIGRLVAELLPGLHEPVSAIARQVLATGAPVSSTLEGETPAQPGVRRSWDESWAPFRDAAGTIRGFNVAVEETTEKRRMTAALDAAHARRAEILENMAEGFVTLDFAFRVTAINREGERLDGRTREQLVGLTHWEAWPASLGTPVEAAYRKAMTERVPVALEHRYVDGARDVWLDIQAYPIPDGLALQYRDITERKRGAERREVLVHELSHRVKNTLAVVRAIATQTLQDGCEEQTRADFEGRLLALARAQDLLTREEWSDVPLRDIAARALAPFMTDQLRVEGPAVRVPPKASVSLCMAFHELATNAAKYGALSVPEGRVSLDWRVEEGRLRIHWREEGGPPVIRPKARGFGSLLIEHSLASDLDAEVQLTFHMAGAVCTIDAPLPGSSPAMTHVAAG